MDQGKVVYDPPSLSQTATYTRERLGMLFSEYKHFENPHTYKVGISSRLKALREGLIAGTKHDVQVMRRILPNSRAVIPAFLSAGFQCFSLLCFLL